MTTAPCPVCGRPVDLTVGGIAVRHYQDRYVADTKRCRGGRKEPK